MKCSDARKEISESIWADDQIHNDEVKAHLVACKKCTMFYYRYSSAVQALKNDISLVKPDISLKDKILYEFSQSSTGLHKAKQQTNLIIRPALKVLWSMSAAAAAIIIGIIAGNFTTGNNGNNSEKEKYFKEISMNSADLSGINDNLLMYSDIEQSDENGK